MLRDVTLVTPTADQPIGMELCERYMREQTAWGRVAEWVVVDDGTEKAELTLGQTHIRRERGDYDTTESFCLNLMAAEPHIKSDLIVFIEHDDDYHPWHLEVLLDHLERPDVLAAGDGVQRYYHVGLRQWRVFDNWGASLCQTGIRREALPIFVRAAETCLAGKWRGVDAQFWSQVQRAHWSVYRAEQVVGIKGLPGRPGIGIGHRPAESDYDWASDPGATKLREWCGPHAGNYLDFWEGA